MCRYPGGHTHPTISTTHVHIVLLTVIPTIGSNNSITCLLRYQFCLRGIISIRLRNVTILLPRLTNCRSNVVRQPLKLFRDNLRIIRNMLPILQQECDPNAIFYQRVLFTCRIAITFTQGRGHMFLTCTAEAHACSNECRGNERSRAFDKLPTILLPFSNEFRLLHYPCTTFLLSSTAIPTNYSTAFSTLPILIIFSTNFSELTEFKTGFVTLQVTFTTT